MRIGLVVDSACDLPKSFLDQHRIAILPITLRIADHTFHDNRDPAVTASFYREHFGQRGQDAETSPFSVDQIRALFLERLVLEHDHVLVLTIAGSRSPIHDNAQQAAHGILTAYKAVRARAGLQGPFTVRVIDTQNLFAGQGVTAVEAVRLIRAGRSATEVRERIEALVPDTYGYMLPRDLYFLRARAQKKGDRSVGLLSAALGTALDIKPVIRGHRGDTSPVGKVRGFDEGARRLFAFAGERVRAGLLAPTVCISYGGDLKELEALPGHADLLAQCRAAKVEVFSSVMSMTGAINVGEGALALGFACGPHDFTA
jgi:DegV family protein with EDD domain